MREVPRITRARFVKLMLASVIAGCALVVGAPGVADAQPGGPRSPSAEVLVIHGTTCAAPTVDPAIGEVPPLKHNCWKLLDKRLLPLAQGTPSTMPLPNGRIFQVAYNGLSPDKRFKVAASISKPDGVGFNPLAEITAEPGKKFHVGGFAYQNGSLVLAIRIVP
jgi:hypothetical protein